MILDTTFIIDVMRKDEKAVQKLQTLIDSSEPALITAPTIFELFSGLAQSKKPTKEKERILAVLSNQVIVNLDNESAEKAGRIDGNLIIKGNMIEPIDSMIAGIALCKNESIITRNTKHFKRIKGLSVEEY